MHRTEDSTAPTHPAPPSTLIPTFPYSPTPNPKDTCWSLIRQIPFPLLHKIHAKSTPPLADLPSKILDARPLLGVQIFSISCSFWENLAKMCVHAPPPPRGFTPPPGGNPGSATDHGREFPSRKILCPWQW